MQGEAARASCNTKADHWGSQWCLAVVYDTLGRHAEAGVRSRGNFTLHTVLERRKLPPERVSQGRLDLRS
jgi:hypothetical protein